MPIISVDIIRAIGEQIEPRSTAMSGRERGTFQSIIQDVTAKEVEKYKMLSSHIESLQKTIASEPESEYRRGLCKHVIKLLDKLTA